MTDTTTITSTPVNRTVLGAGLNAGLDTAMPDTRSDDAAAAAYPADDGARVALALAVRERITRLRCRGFSQREKIMDPMSGNLVTTWTRTWKGLREVVATLPGTRSFAVAYQVWAEDSPDDALIADPDLVIWRTGGSFIACVDALLKQPSHASCFPGRAERDRSRTRSSSPSTDSAHGTERARAGDAGS